MKYRKIGYSGLKVSEISLGSYLTVSEIDSVKLIHTAMELGINSFDTANTYQDGEAERILGKALENVPRDEFVIGTKAFWPTGKGPNSRGLSRKHLTEQVNASLKRMNMEYIDIFYCHHYDIDTPIEETLRTLDDLIKQGKILYAGVSNWTIEQLRDAVQTSEQYLLNKIIVNQCEYSLLKRDNEKSLLPHCKELGISQIAFSPLAQGILTGKYNTTIPKKSRATNPSANKFFHKLYTEENIQIVKILEDIASKYDCTLTELALNWVLREENISSALVGASTLEQLEKNVGAVEKEVPEELFFEVETLFIK